MCKKALILGVVTIIKWRIQLLRNDIESKGQASVEMLIIMSMFVLLVLAMMMIIPTFEDYCWRILSLVALDYP